MALPSPNLLMTAESPLTGDQFGSFCAYCDPYLVIASATRVCVYEVDADRCTAELVSTTLVSDTSAVLAVAAFKTESFSYHSFDTSSYYFAASLQVLGVGVVAVYEITPGGPATPVQFLFDAGMTAGFGGSLHAWSDSAYAYLLVGDMTATAGVHANEGAGTFYTIERPSISSPPFFTKSWTYYGGAANRQLGMNVHVVNATRFLIAGGTNSEVVEVAKAGSLWLPVRTYTGIGNSFGSAISVFKFTYSPYYRLAIGEWQEDTVYVSDSAGGLVDTLTGGTDFGVAVAFDPCGRLFVHDASGVAGGNIGEYAFLLGSYRLVDTYTAAPAGWTANQFGRTSIICDGGVVIAADSLGVFGAMVDAGYVAMFAPHAVAVPDVRLAGVISLACVGGSLVYSRARDGGIVRESTVHHHDPGDATQGYQAYVPMVVESGTFKLAGFEGFQRLRSAGVSAALVDPHDVVVTIIKDGSEETKTWTATELAALITAPEENVSIRVAKQRCSKARIRIEDTAPSGDYAYGAGFTLDGFTLQIGIRRSQSRLQHYLGRK